VYVVNRPYYPPPYRPPVYAGYRPAYGYNPPATYHWNQYNRNVNVNVNNNYYNQFHNTNLGSTATNRPENYRGQSTYQGARTTNTVGQKPGASMANAYQPNREPQMASRNSAIENRGGNQQLARSNSNNLSGATMNRPSQQPANFNRGGDRGYGTAGNNTQLASNSNTLAQNRGASSPSPAAQNRAGSDDRGGAFGNSGGLNAKSDRAASTRGRSSMSAGGGGRQRH